MLLSRIAPDYSGAMVRTSHICAQNLFWKRFVNVYEQVLVKIKVTHYLYVILMVLNYGTNLRIFFSKKKETAAKHIISADIVILNIEFGAD